MRAQVLDDVTLATYKVKGNKIPGRQFRGTRELFCKTSVISCKS